MKANRMKEVKEPEDEIDVKSIMRDMVDIAKLSYEQEEKREQSLLYQASQMLTALSFSSAAVLMVVPILIANLPDTIKTYILICMGLTMMFFVSSMVLALLVQWRYKYQALPSPMDIFIHISENVQFFNTEEQRYKNWVEMLNANWISKRKNNDKRVNLIRASMILFFCAILVILVSVIYGNIILSIL